MQYQSPFENWYTYSTVHKPLPDFTCEPGLVLFPAELVPGVGHPLIDKLGNDATRRLTMRKLESYNAFTEKLEYKAVMAASIKIAQDPQAFGLSEQAGREARLIVTDESHHAYVVIELIKQIPGFSELPPLTATQPRFLRGLEELERGLPTELADDLLIAFVSISETLITSILRGIPRDLRVVSAVRNTVRDHCIDEARHHSYDEAQFGWLGPEITLVREAIAAEKTLLGICLGAQIIAKALGRAGISGKRQRNRLVSCPADRLTSFVRWLAR